MYRTRTCGELSKKDSEDAWEIADGLNMTM